MKNNEINENFLNSLDAKTRSDILNSIAKHYGVSTVEIFEEVTHEEAEHLLDYMVEPYRSATYVIMKRHGMM